MDENVAGPFKPLLPSEATLICEPTGALWGIRVHPPLRNQTIVYWPTIDPRLREFYPVEELIEETAVSGTAR